MVQWRHGLARSETRLKLSQKEINQEQPENRDSHPKTMGSFFHAGRGFFVAFMWSTLSKLFPKFYFPEYWQMPERAHWLHRQSGFRTTLESYGIKKNKKVYRKYTNSEHCAPARSIQGPFTHWPPMRAMSQKACLESPEKYRNNSGKK